MFVREIKCKKCKQKFKHYTHKKDHPQRPAFCDYCNRKNLNEQHKRRRDAKMKALSVFIIIIFLSKNVNALEMTAQDFIEIQERNCRQVEHIKNCHEYAKDRLENIMLKQAQKHVQEKRSDGVELTTYLEPAD